MTATPVLIDITAPQNPYAVINHGAFMTNSPEVVVTISANDIDTGVGAYLCLRSPDDTHGRHAGMGGCDAGIKFGATIPFILSPGDGQKTIYVWFKDVGGNVSTPASATILVNTSGYLCVSHWGQSGRGASLLHGGEFMAPMYGLCVDQQGALFVVDNGNNRVQKFDNAGNFIILWGNFGAANANFHNPDRHRVRRERRRVGRRYEQPPRPEIRRKAGRLPHEIRLARQRRRASSTRPGALPSIACAGMSMSSTAPTSGCRNST